MRKYIITLLVIAFLVGTLFKAADQTGVRVMKMFGTVGILLFGAIGTMALTRWQSRTGLQEIEQALKAVEPEGIITDWSDRRDGRPDYLVVLPGAAAVVCVDDMAQAIRGKRALTRIGKARRRTLGAVEWLRAALTRGTSADDVADSHLAQVPIAPVLVLSRRRVQAEDADEGVAVLNADQLTGYLKNYASEAVLDATARVRMTRTLRQG